jgi:hypothetical protein
MTVELNKEQADAVVAVIEEKWRQRFSSGNHNTDITNFLSGLKDELIADMQALTKPKDLGPTDEQVRGSVKPLGLNPLEEKK